SEEPIRSVIPAYEPPKCLSRANERNRPETSSRPHRSPCTLGRGEADVASPETRFAKSGDAHIAYQVVGSGPRDLGYVPGWVSNVGLNWDDPAYARFLTRLSTFARLILFDKRGTGLSDRIPGEGLPTLEQRMDDVRAVLDAVGSERAALLGVSEGGSMCAL